ncbi:pyrroline-5-carboxylate reductase [Patescibacteria group bacterium]|nr:pyrroline-5-carboxylate reductase [Patescibacteria group bacterium]
MKKNKKILVVGCGNMGQAIISQLLDCRFSSRKYLAGFDKAKNRAKVRGLYDIDMVGDLNKAIDNADIIIFSIKPQQFNDIAKQIKGRLKPNQLVVSIMAGISYKHISQSIKHKKVVRAMPNLALQVGHSVTAWYTPRAFVKSVKSTTNSLLSVFGAVLEVKKEDMIDKVTAISGSGPAYFFFTAEALESVALDFGFNKRQAAMLAKDTFIGAAKLAQVDKRDNKKLRQAVTSKGGTTEAAIREISTDFLSMWRRALKAAHQRAKVISKKYESR